MPTRIPGSSEPIGPASAAALRSARRLLARKGREVAGEFLVEGPQAVREALAAGVVLRTFCTREAAERHPDLVAVRPVLVTADDLARLSDTVTPQGLVAVCRVLDADLRDVVDGDPGLVVVCAQVRDPGNAGTVIRCADAFGARGVLLSAGSVEATNPKTVRASVGSIFHLPVVSGLALEAAVDALRQAGYRILAADGAGARDLDALATSGDLTGPVAWLFGNEAWGLPPEQAALADEVVRVGMWGRAESLNLSTAAAVCLYTTAAAQHR